MFMSAIESAAEFTRPIHTILRYFKSTEVYPAAATLFFVNDQGWALTCRHVAELLLAGDQLKTRYQAFKTELNALAGKKRRHAEKELERKYDFNRSQVIEVRNMVVGCAEGPITLTFQLHPQYDVALIKVDNYTRLICTTFPVFARNGADLKQGKFLCRLGFPFPEFTNFEYDPTSDSIRWTKEGRQQTPRFPIEGMVTRHLLDPGGLVFGFEVSTPGLRGQSGGPAFDAEGRIWGMQSSTMHLDLNFDVDLELVRKNTKKRVKDSAFLHVGHSIHVDVLKQFMREHKVAFAEG